jgi:hypothetical protein
MTAIDTKSRNLVITADVYHATAISPIDILAPGVSSWRRLCFQPSWRLDIATADHEAIAQYCNTAAGSVEVHTQAAADDAELVCLYFMRRTLEEGCDLQASQPLVQKYIDWMTHNVQGDSTHELVSGEC